MNAIETTGTTTSAVSSHIAIIDGKPTTTTHDIAEVYGKRHDRVLAVVRQRMTEAGEWGIHNFVDTPYTNQQNGQTYPVIRMTKKGFHFVVGKFTGAKAVQHQIAFADEFERMEAALTAQLSSNPLQLPSDTSSLAPYSVQPGQTLSEDQAQTLRAMLDEFVKTLPKEKQGAFIVKGWAKLKAHFDVGYRQIPAAQFTDAVSIIARHIVEYSAPALPAPAQAELDFSIVSLKNKRFFHIFDHKGREHIQRVPNDAMMLNFDEMPYSIKNGLPSMAQLVGIVSAGVEAMAKRSGYGKPDPMPA